MLAVVREVTRTSVPVAVRSKNMAQPADPPLLAGPAWALSVAAKEVVLTSERLISARAFFTLSMVAPNLRTHVGPHTFSISDFCWVWKNLTVFSQVGFVSLKM